MSKIDRRKFLQQTMLGSAGFILGSQTLNRHSIFSPMSEKIDQVVLGKSGVSVSRLAWGTGTNGWKRVSNQTKLGMKKFLEIAEYALASGITFFDAADIYGSHPYLKEVLKRIPREKIVILSKIWTSSNDWLEFKGAQQALDRFRTEIGTDYIDIVLLHCQTSPHWISDRHQDRDVLSKAKQDGLIRAHGVSCHSLEALKTAAQSEWVDILLARINNIGARMDDKPDVVMPILKQAHDAGKGVLGMKVYGCGELIKEEQREGSLKFVLGSGNVDALTIGFENVEQIADTIKRINRMVNEKKSN